MQPTLLRTALNLVALKGEQGPGLGTYEGYCRASTASNVWSCPARPGICLRSLPTTEIAQILRWAGEQASLRTPCTDNANRASIGGVRAVEGQLFRPGRCCPGGLNYQ